MAGGRAIASKNIDRESPVLAIMKEPNPIISEYLAQRDIVLAKYRRQPDDPAYLSIYFQPTEARWLETALTIWTKHVYDIAGVVHIHEGVIHSQHEWKTGRKRVRLSEIQPADHPGIEALTLTSFDRVKDKRKQFLTRFDGAAKVHAEGREPPPHGIFAWCLDLVEDGELKQLAECMTSLVAQVASECACRYALVEIESARFSSNGFVHQDGCYRSDLPFMRDTTKAVLLAEADKLTTRGVFWMNWFGRDMCERLGGANRLVSEYSRLDDAIDCDLASVIGDGALLRITSDFRSMLPPYVFTGMETRRRAAWLYSKLAQARLLPGLQMEPEDVVRFWGLPMKRHDDVR